MTDDRLDPDELGSIVEVDLRRPWLKITHTDRFADAAPPPRLGQPPPEPPRPMIRRLLIGEFTGSTLNVSLDLYKRPPLQYPPAHGGESGVGINITVEEARALRRVLGAFIRKHEGAMIDIPERAFTEQGLTLVKIPPPNGVHCLDCSGFGNYYRDATECPDVPEHITEDVYISDVPLGLLDDADFKVGSRQLWVYDDEARSD